MSESPLPKTAIPSEAKMARILKATELKLGQRPALILVDLIKGFTDPVCPLGSDCTEVITANQQLLQAFRDRKLPVFFTTVVYEHFEQARVFRSKIPALNILTPESRWVEVDLRLEKCADEVLIAKRWASAFFGTDLKRHLDDCGVDSLVVTGLTTSGCVRATAVDGLQSDYPVIIPCEAVGDRDPAAHVANLNDLDRKYASVITLSKVLEQLPKMIDGKDERR